MGDRISLTLRSGVAPEWPCPGCGLGLLILHGKNPLRNEETAASASTRAETDEWEADWFEERFSLHLVCNRCADPVVVTGQARHHREMVAEHEEWAGLLLDPEHVVPPLRFFSVRNLPKDVEEGLHRSFKLFWADPGSSLNALRSSLELVMTAQGIPQRRKNKRGKYEALKLHTRIELFAAKQPRIGEAILAVKWLGNAGSHPGFTPTQRNVLEAYELVEHALIELYERRSNRLATLAKRIIKTKGKPTRKRRARKP